jgi:hypothetical protein
MRVGRLIDGITTPLFEDANAAGAAGGSTGAPEPAPIGDGKSDLISRAEAQKAFKARDEEKARARQLEARIKELEQLERDRETKAEEERLKAAGQWESLRDQLAKKHAQEKEELSAKLSEADKRLRDYRVANAFATASDLFGREAFTIYNAKAAERIFGPFVQVGEDGNLAVHDASGDVILDAATGKPASFAQAMRELIVSLPDKNDHIRGSGKTGSGSSGGSTGSDKPVDLRNLTPARLRDPKVLEALKASRPASGITMGSSLQK